MGMVTFAAGASGTIQLGDYNTDNVVFNADIDSAYETIWEKGGTLTLPTTASTATSTPSTGGIRPLPELTLTDTR